MDIYCERIKPLFKDSGLSDLQLEQSIGLPRSIIYKWDNGVNASYKNYVDKIAAYFDVTTDYLLGKTDMKKAPVQTGTDALLEDEIVLLEIYRKLSPDRKKNLLRFGEFEKNSDD